MKRILTTLAAIALFFQLAVAQEYLPEWQEGYMDIHTIATGRGASRVCSVESLEELGQHFFLHSLRRVGHTELAGAEALLFQSQHTGAGERIFLPVI